MALEVDISVVGAPELIAKFGALEAKMQTKIARAAMRASAKRIKARVVANVSGQPVGVFTGRLLAAFTRAKIKTERAKQGGIRLGVALPTRAELGIRPDEKGYYPTALEYGTDKMPARPYLRPAVDNHRDQELTQIGKEIGQAVETEGHKLGFK